MSEKLSGFSSTSFDLDPRDAVWRDSDYERGYDSHLGNVIGSLTIHSMVMEGDHPEYIRDAWTGLSLPLRPGYHKPRRHEDESVDGTIRVYQVDGLNALVHNGRDAAVGYWVEKRAHESLYFNATGQEVCARFEPPF